MRDLFGEEAAQVSVVVGEGKGCPYSEDEVMEWVRRALSGTKNNSAARPDGVGYRMIKAVLIPKPGRDLTQTKNWRPLNLINCIGKLGEKVVADRIQDEGSSILHPQQYGSVRGCSAVNVLYRSVVKARQSLEGGGSVGWAFWDVKGGFQNVRSA